MGSLCAQEAVQRGHTVRAVTRRSVEIPGVEVQVSDFSQQAFSEVLQDVDTVVVALGHRWGQKTAFQARIMKELVTALECYPQTACVMLTGYGVTLPGERYPFIDQAFNWLVAQVRPTMMADGKAASQVLMRSSTPWTVLRAPLILRLPKKGYRLTAVGEHGRWTTCVDAAQALLDCLQRPELRGQAPVLSRAKRLL